MQPPRLPSRALRAAAIAVAAAIFAACGGADRDPAADPPAVATCSPVAVSPTDAYAIERDPASTEVALARAIADRWIAEHPPESLAWDWGEGTLVAGLVDLYRVTGAAAYRDYARAWLDYRISRGYQITVSDRCPPADTAIALHRETCDAKYRAVVDDVLRYLAVDARRTDDGGISHMGTVPGFPPQLWVDSLFMFGEVLIREAEASGDAGGLATWAEQYRIFASHLQQPATGLFEHAWGVPGAPTPGVPWGRGNGWVLAAASDYLRVRGLRGEADADVLASFRELADALVARQDPDTGLLWTVLDRPGETYLETSATALLALGLARGRRAGALDATVLPAIERALDGVRSRLRDDDRGRPVVTGISGPTSVGSFDDYAKVPLQDDVTFGVGAVVMALVEASGVR